MDFSLFILELEARRKRELKVAPPSSRAGASSSMLTLVLDRRASCGATCGCEPNEKPTLERRLAFSASRETPSSHETLPGGW